MSRLPELVSHARLSRIPAPALRAVTLAQWLLESDRGKSQLAREHLNFAGLKWREEMKGIATPVEYRAHDGVDIYCVFESVPDFIAGYWRFVNRPIYAGWADFADDPRGYISFLHDRGYATDPDYVRKVLSLVAEAEMLLGGDERHDIVEPARPNRPEIGESLLDNVAAGTEPAFVTHAHVRQRFRGARPNGPEGAIVHYDAFRTRLPNGGDDPEWGARRSLEIAVENGYAYITISRGGKVHLPANMDWMSWGYHAGPSRCPETKRDGVSQYYVGLEINCPGLVYPTKDEDLYVPWFEAVRNSEGDVVLDSKGRATPLKRTGEHYKKSEVRIITSQRGNIRPGAYVPYTEEQVKALRQLLLWLRMTNPQTFRLDRVFGHDEVSPGRKVDPGASLGVDGSASEGKAMTMAALRASLQKDWAEILAAAA